MEKHKQWKSFPAVWQQHNAYISEVILQLFYTSSGALRI